MAESHPDFEKHMAEHFQRIAEAQSNTVRTESEHPDEGKRTSRRPLEYIQAALCTGARGDDELPGGMSRLRRARLDAMRTLPRDYTGTSPNMSASEDQQAGSTSKPRRSRLHWLDRYAASPSAPYRLPSARDLSSSSTYRVDHGVRTSALSVISAIIQNEDLDPDEAVDQLESCKTSCQESGVPFSELLTVAMDPTGVTPLLYELVAFRDPLLLEFLLENTPAQEIDRTYRRGCLIRGDNDVFQGLRARFSATDGTELVPYDLSVKEQSGKFRVKASIPHLADLLARLRVDPEDRKRPLPRPIEWIASGRIWKLEVTKDDRLVFGLIDGNPASLSAMHLTLFPHPATAEFADKAPAVAPSSFAFSNRGGRKVASLHNCSLVPLSQAGPHTVVLPSLLSFGEPMPLQECCTDSGTLILELDVVVEDGKAEDDDEKSFLSLDDDEWERVDCDKEWVLASWSGKDEDATD